MDTYDDAVASTAIYPDAGEQNEIAISYVTLGLLGEAGEIANKFKKVLRGDLTLADAKPALVDELGDVLWYLTRLAAELGVSIDELQKANTAKLMSRKERDVIRGTGDER